MDSPRCTNNFFFFFAFLPDVSSKKRICLIGTVASDPDTIALAESFGVPVETSDTGIDKLAEREWITYFIVSDFSGPIFEELQKSIHE